MIDKIKKILKDEYDIKELRMDMNIKNDLGLTSLDFANLICILEEQLDIEIDEENYRQIVTVEDFVNYIESLKTD